LEKKRYYHLIDPNKDLTIPQNLSQIDLQQNMLQWLHMENIILNFRNELLTYDIIFKFRFDTIIKNSQNYFDLITKITNDTSINTIYNESDKVFYGNSITFIKSFEDFYNTIISETHLHKNISENNFDTSWKSEPAFRHNLKKKNIQNVKIELNVEIVRGDYPKIVGDGNNKLFDGNNLLGKFQ
jgi:hypothetical protein